jgi:hypothetical protein
MLFLLWQEILISVLELALSVLARAWQPLEVYVIFNTSRIFDFSFSFPE